MMKYLPAFLLLVVGGVSVWAEPDAAAAGIIPSDTQVEPVMTVVTGKTLMISGDTSHDEATTTEKWLDIQATSDSVVATTLEKLKTKDLDARIEAFEGVMDGLEVVAEELDSMEIGQPWVDGLLKRAAANVDSIIKSASDVLHYMRKSQAEQEQEQEQDDNKMSGDQATAAVASSFRGRHMLEKRDSDSDSDTTPKYNNGYDDVDGGPKSSDKRRRHLTKKPSSSSNKGHHDGRGHTTAKYRRTHRFENRRAAHHHDRINKLQDAVLGGDHHHIGNFLTSVRSKVDGGQSLSHSGGRRRLTAAQKAAQCFQLTQCAKDMSFYDTLTFFYSDDIDPATGEIDDSIIHFSEQHLEARHYKVKMLANDLWKMGGNDKNKYTDSQTIAIKVFSDPTLCIKEDNWNAIMATCDQSKAQEFRYDPLTMSIKVGSRPSNNNCLQHDKSGNVIIGWCGGREFVSGVGKWFVTHDNHLKTVDSDKCLELSTNKNLQMAYCSNTEIQKFTLPTGYDPTKFKSPGSSKIRVFANQNHCMESNPTTSNVYMQPCKSINHQEFTYNPVTRQWKTAFDDTCLTYDPNNNNVYRQACTGGVSQKWYLHDDIQIKNEANSGLCLDMDTNKNNVQMYACSSNNNQQWSAPVFTSHSRVSPKDYHYSFGFMLPRSDNSLCMQRQQDKLVRTVGCHRGSSQRFRYNPVNKAIEALGVGCMEFDPNVGNSAQVKVIPCNGMAHQQWYMTAHNEIKSISSDSLCMDWGGSANSQVIMKGCDGNANQKFSTEPMEFFLPAVLSTNSKCDDLLQLFHRNVEWDDVPHWEGGTVSQVCLAEGSQVFLKLDEIALKVGTYYAKKVADEIFHCSRDLFDSPARTNPKEHFPFTTATHPNDLVAPTGLNMANRDEHGMIADITQPLYAAGTQTAKSEIMGRVSQMSATYLNFWNRVHVDNKDYPMEPGISNPIGWYESNEDWKNTYFRTDRLLKVLHYLDEDQAPPGPRGDGLLTQLWAEVDAQRQLEGNSRTNQVEKLIKGNTENIKECFEGIQHGYDLVFGEKTSVGFICGVRDAVRADSSKWPGRCCLDAPFQETGDDWGRKHACTTTCKNPGPFFSGISEESCSANGGNWCANPTDCSVLKSCLETAYNTSLTKDEQNRTKSAFANYLKPGLVNRSDSFDDCSSSREYFGFDPLYSNDADICDNVMQLHNTRNFAFLEEFFKQGSSGGEISGAGESWKALTEPSRARSGSTPVHESIEWRASLFAIHQYMDVQAAIVKSVVDISCPADITGAAQTSCALMKNVMIPVLASAHTIIKLGFAIAQYTMETLAEETDLEAAQSNENIAVVFDNMKALNTNLGIIHNAVKKQCGSTTRRALQSEGNDDVDELLALQKQNEVMNTKLDDQQKLNQAMMDQIQSLTIMMQQLMDMQGNQVKA